MALEEVGRVGIRAVPDTRKFESDLKKAIERAEGRVKVKVNAVFDDRAIRRVTSRLAEQEIQVNLAVNEKKIEQDLERTINKVEERGLQLQAHAETFAASRQIAIAARPRVVLLIAKVSESSLASAAGALASLAGARLIGDQLSDVAEYLSEIDRNLPALAKAAVGIGALSAVGLAAAGSLFNVGASLASIAGVAITLPGILAGFGIGLGVTIAAAKDASTVLADLGPRFARLQDVISAEFWGQAEAPIRRLVTTLLPQLRESLAGVADAIGSFTGEWANELRAQLQPEVLAGMMDNLEESIRIATRALEPLVSAFTTLGTVGSEYLPRLAEWFVEASDRFNEFITAAAESGELQEWADRGIFNMQQLARFIGELSGVFAGIADAANAAGLLDLEKLADGFAAMHEAVDHPEFQGALTTVFAGAAAGLVAMGEALGPLNEAFQDIAPTLSEVLATAGEIVGVLVTGLAEAFQNPELQQGMQDFFDGLLEAAEVLAPALEPLAGALGAFLTFAGELAREVGPTLAAIFETLAPILEEVFVALEPLLPILGELVRDLVEELGPEFMHFAEETLPRVVALISEHTDEAAILFETAFVVIDRALEATIAILENDWPAALDAMTREAELSTALVENRFDSMGFQVGLTISKFAVATAAGFISMRVRIAEVIARLVLGVISFFTGMRDSVGERAAEMTGRVISTIASLPSEAQAALGNIGSTLVEAGTRLVLGFIAGIREKFSAVREVLSNLTALLPDWKGPAELDRVILRDAGQLVMEGFVDGLNDGFTGARDTLAGFTDSLSGEVSASWEAQEPSMPSQQFPDRLYLETDAGTVIARLANKGVHDITMGRRSLGI